MKTGSKFYYLVMTFILVALGYLSYRIVYPYLTPIIWAIVLTVMFYPVYIFTLKYVKRKWLSALITLFIVLLILFGPVSYLLYLITQDVVAFVKNIESGSLDSVTTFFKYPATNSFVRKMLSLFQITEQEFQKGLIQNVTKFGQDFAGIVKTGLGNILTGTIDFVLMILTMYFLLVDGPNFVQKIGSFIPFSSKEKVRLLRQTKDIVISTMYGGVTVAVAQGIVGGLVFALLGIQSAVLWGASMFIASFIPMVGTFVVWGPLGAYLFIQGHYVKGIILLALCIGAVGTIDNILRPFIMKGRTRMPVIVIFFSILGGVQAFGFIGLILGPLIFALFVSVFEIYRYSEEKSEEEGML